MAVARIRLKAAGAESPWNSWECMVHVSLAFLDLSTFLRVIVGIWASRDSLRFSGSLVWMYSFGRLVIRRSYLLASRVIPYVAEENVGVITM